MDSALANLTGLSFLSIATLAVVYYFLITEKVNKVIVAVLGAVFLIVAQIFKGADHTSQEGAIDFIANNLDVLGFVLGMMVLVGIVRESGVFEALAVWLVKKVRGRPIPLLIVIGYLTFIMTTFLSNIPTVLILAPVLIVLIKELKLPYFPYFFLMITMANLGGAMTPISDPTTYYQAKTVGLSFTQVLSNSGLMVILLSVVSVLYTLILFRHQLQAIKVKEDDISLFDPSQAIKNKRILYLGLPILIGTVGLMVLKETIRTRLGITLDNATITIGGAFLAMLLFHKKPKVIFKRIIDWEILFFFTGLFIIVGSLEITHVIESLAHWLIQVTQGSLAPLIVLLSSGSAIISTFIDNVPYNITMVGAVLNMRDSGIYVYPLWWALNLGTSIGGVGSPIAAAANVIVIAQAEKEKMRLEFFHYLKVALPLVVINSLIVAAILIFRFARG